MLPHRASLLILLDISHRQLVPAPLTHTKQHCRGILRTALHHDSRWLETIDLRPIGQDGYMPDCEQCTSVRRMLCDDAFACLHWQFVRVAVPSTTELIHYSLERLK